MGRSEAKKKRKKKYGQADALKEPEAHPYDIDWNKYDQLQKAPEIEGEVR